MEKSFSSRKAGIPLSDNPAEATSKDARQRAMGRAKTTPQGEGQTPLASLASEALAHAPWDEGYSSAVTVSIPTSLASAVLAVGAQFLIENGRPSPKKSEIFATMLRNGLSLIIDHALDGTKPTPDSGFEVGAAVWPIVDLTVHYADDDGGNRRLEVEIPKGTKCIISDMIEEPDGSVIYAVDAPSIGIRHHEAHERYFSVFPPDET